MRRVAWIGVICGLGFFCVWLCSAGKPASGTNAGGVFWRVGQVESPSSLQLAGRYHLRTRTQRFFARAAA